MASLGWLKMPSVWETIMAHERIPFRLFNMQCCGTRVWPDVKGWALVNDMNATLKYEDKDA